MDCQYQHNALGFLQLVGVLDGVRLVFAPPVRHLTVELGDEALQLLLALLLLLQLLLQHLALLPH